MNIPLEIIFGSRAAENYSRAPESIRARLTTEHATSSYGMPVVVLADGTALGRTDVAALAPPGYWAGIRPLANSASELFGLAGPALRALGYEENDTTGGWFA